MKRFFVFCLIMCVLVSISPVALALQQNDAVTYTVNDGIAHINGSADSGEPNLAVVLQVLRPNAVPQEITTENFLDKVLFYEQCSTDGSGKFSFDFKVPKSDGDYTAYVKVFDEASPRIFSISGNALDASMKFDAFGHIYYDSANIPIEFGLSSGVAAESIKIKLKITDTTGYNSQEIHKEISAGIGNNVFRYNLNLTDEVFQYGVFNISAEVEDEFGNTVTKEDEFSVIHSPVDGVLNRHMGAQYAFHKNQWGAEHTEQSIDNFTELMRKAGIGNGRHGVYWRDYENNPVKNSDGTVTSGDYELQEITASVINNMIEKGITPLYCMHMTPKEYKTVYDGTNADETLGSVVQVKELEKLGKSSLGELTDSERTALLERVSNKTGYLNPLSGFDALKNGTLLDYLPVADVAQAGYAKFAGEFASDTPGVEYYEVWNEPNLKNFNPQGATAKHYADLLKQTYEKIHEYRANAKVVGMAAAFDYCDGASGEKNSRAYLWMEEVLKNLGTEKRYMDAVSVHIYKGASLPEGNLKDYWADKIRELFRNYGYDDIELLMTETGYSTGTMGAVEKLPLRQAAFEIRDYAVNGRSYDKWFKYCAVETTTGDEYEDGLGMLKSFSDEKLPYGAKPLYAAIANYNSLLSDAVIIKAETGTNSTPYHYEYKDSAGNTVHMLWMGGSAYKDCISQKDYTIDIGTANVTVFDMFGNSSEKSSADGVYTLSLSGSPIYVKCDADVSVEYFNADNGYVITDFGSDAKNVKARVQVNKNKSDLQNAVVIGASYSLVNGSFEQCEVEYVKDKSTFEYNFNVENTGRIKIFIWNVKDALNPLFDVKILERR